jgi:rare lipoprotein A
MRLLLPFLFAAMFLLTSCAEVELGSHLYKKWEGPSANTQVAQQGTFKVGKPYTVMGRTYVPRETYDYVETGIASWYGPGFHGNKTASGEKYDNNELTAAHRTLQMPSLVRVTNLDNGKSVIVRVNDRGPFAKGRIIDVSKRAAELLEMTRAGTAKVRIELLADESRILAQVARSGKSTKGVEVAFNQTGRLPGSMTMTDAGSQVAMLTPQQQRLVSSLSQEEQNLAYAAKADTVKGHYHEGHFYPDPVVTQQAVIPTGIYVQAGAFGVRENAAKLQQKLQAISPARVDPVAYGGKTLYRVRIGPLDSVRTADNVLSRVLSSGQSDAIIIVQ